MRYVRGFTKRINYKSVSYTHLHPRLEFGNGVIHQDKIITNTVRDIPVIIDSLGNFTVGLLFDYPIQQTIFFQKGYLHFYIEPGGFLKIETSMDVLTTPYRYVAETDLSDPLTRYRCV